MGGDASNKGLTSSCDMQQNKKVNTFFFIFIKAIFEVNVKL